MINPAGPTSTLFSRAETAAREFSMLCCASRKNSDVENVNTTASTLSIVGLQMMVISRLSQGMSQEYMDAYLKYARAAGELYASDQMFISFPTPNIMECLQGSNCPLTFQIGPIEMDDSSQLCDHRVIHAIMTVALKYFEQSTKLVCNHHIYAGICAPRSGSGFTSIYFWMPTILRTPSEIRAIKKGIHATLMRDAKIFSPEFNPIFDRKRCPIEKSAILAALTATSHAAGVGGAIPMMWCADPVIGRIKSQEQPLWPIIPICLYGSLSAVAKNDTDDELVIRINITSGLDDCWRIGSNVFLEFANRNITVVEWSDTNGPWNSTQHVSAVIRNAGVRPLESVDVTTYDTLPFVCSSGFNAIGQVIIAPGAAPTNIFDTCTTDTTDKYNAVELLRLISPRRFDTTTFQSLAVCAEILHALKCMNEAEGAAEPSGSALGLLANIAQSSGVLKFDPAALAAHHSDNYSSRPPRSMRTLAYYAMIDSPGAYYRLLATRIWSKITTMTDPKETVPLAEALAAYLSLTHYVIPGQNKNVEQLFFFKSPRFHKAGNAKNYLSQLLSTDISCGHLHAVLASYRGRLNTLLGMINPASGAATSGSVTLLQKYGEVIAEVISQLRMGGYKNRLTVEILSKLEQEQSIMKVCDRTLSDDIRLTCVGNGTLEVVTIGQNRKIFWRPATPEDMNDRPINAMYDDRIRGTQRWNTIVRHYERYIANPRIRNWYLCQLAESFLRENNKIATFIVGPTNCGKSVDIMHIKEFFGPGKMESIASNAFSDAKAGMDTPQPAITRAASANIATVEETSGVIRNSIFKVIVGGNAEAPWRTLYEEGKSMVFRAKPIFVNNNLPKFENYEGAVFTRLAIFTPSARYLEIGNPELPSDPKMQERLRIFPRGNQQVAVAKLKDAHDAFLLYLMDHFDAWVSENGTKVSLGNFPKEMEEMRDKVRAQCPYAEFVAANMNASDLSTYATVDAVRRRFKAFASSRNISLTGDESFVRSMDIILGTPAQNSRWYGWKLTNVNDGTVGTLETLLGAGITAGIGEGAVTGPSFQQNSLSGGQVSAEPYSASTTSDSWQDRDESMRNDGLPVFSAGAYLVFREDDEEIDESESESSESESSEDEVEIVDIDQALRAQQSDGWGPESAPQSTGFATLATFKPHRPPAPARASYEPLIGVGHRASPEGFLGQTMSRISAALFPDRSSHK